MDDQNISSTLRQNKNAPKRKTSTKTYKIPTTGEIIETFETLENLLERQNTI